jgi:hypothetical protein
MNIGMLWFDNDTKSELDQRIERAVTYYQDKYGRKPTLCFVHPSMLPTAPSSETETEETAYRSGSVEVRATRTVLPHHFWLGVNGVNGSSASSHSG